MTPAKTSPIPKSYVMMSQNDDSDRPRPPLRLVSADPFAEFVHTYGNNRPFQEAYHRILSHYESRHDANKLNGLLLNSGIQHPGVMIPGLQKLAEVLSSHSAETARPYRLWLAQQVYERVYFENRDPRALGEVIRSLADDAKAPVFEQRLAEHFPELDLRAERPLAERPTLSHEFQEFERNTSILPLTDRARLIVFDWKRAQSENYLGNMQTPMDRFLNDIQELGQGPRAARVLEINSAIEAAGDSPFGVARLARLGALLRASQGDPSLERLQELLQK